MTVVPPATRPFAWQTAGDVVWLEVPLDGAVAAFSTRLGGLREGPFRSLNLGILTEDDPQRVRINRERLLAAVGRLPDGLLMGRQVHGSSVQAREEADGEVRPGDGQLTRSPDLTPLVLVADCVPVVLSGGGAVAVLHCGWRGVAAGILERAGEMMDVTSAALGPGIGPCCYEVGDEVLEALPEGATGPRRLDLALAIRARLERLGIPPERIAETGLCTSCDSELFFSHRRDRGVTGRQAGLAWLSS